MIATREAPERISHMLEVEIEVSVDGRCNGDERITTIRMQASTVDLALITEPQARELVPPRAIFRLLLVTCSVALAAGVAPGLRATYQLGKPATVVASLARYAVVCPQLRSRILTA